ncbi:MAG: hypothetical protein Q4A62_05680, partial [Eikenella sp.]|nr:hypothetical protein [Eikenella sp.]
MLNFLKILCSVLWLIKEEFLELTKNFLPPVLLLSLFSVCLYHIWHGENAWDSLLAVLIAMPFGLLFFYAAFTCIAVFYDKSMQKLR